MDDDGPGPVIAPAAATDIGREAAEVSPAHDRAGSRLGAGVDDGGM
jgi:hypothetical protein